MLFIRSFKKKKTFKHYLYMFVVLIVLMTNLLLLNDNLNNYILNKTEVLSNRTLLVGEESSIEQIEEKLLNIKHIEKIELKNIEGSNEQICVITDFSKNNDYVIEKAEERGQTLFLYDWTVKDETASLIKAQKIIEFMIFVIIVTTVGITISLFYLLLKEDHYEMAVLKTVGYKNKKITTIFLRKMGYLLTRSYMVGTVAAFTLGFFLEVMIFKNVNFGLFDFLKSSILTLLTITAILLIVITLGHIKIKKVTPVALFKN